MQQFGWQYTAKQIADWHNITVTEVYDMPTLEAVNTMSYLKGKASFDKEIARNS